jgi:hypothetical protein
MNKYKYIVTYVPSVLRVGGQRLAPLKQECIICNKYISTYIGYYSVTQQKEDWTDCPTKIVCSELCSNMLILASLDDGNQWFRKLRARWSVETSAKLNALHGML